jgi:hypothetical protein
MPAIQSDALKRRPFLLLGALAAAGLAAVTAVLWATYGPAVFFEMLRTGWAACF